MVMINQKDSPASARPAAWVHPDQCTGERMKQVYIRCLRTATHNLFILMNPSLTQCSEEAERATGARMEREAGEAEGAVHARAERETELQFHSRDAFLKYWR